MSNSRFGSMAFVHLLEAMGGATTNELTEIFYGEVNPYTKQKMIARVGSYRQVLKKKGIYVYSVHGRYQVLNADNIVDAVGDNKNRAAAYVMAIHDIVSDGIARYPELRGDLLNLFDDLRPALLNAQNNGEDTQ